MCFYGRARKRALRWPRHHSNAAILVALHLDSTVKGVSEEVVDDGFIQSQETISGLGLSLPFDSTCTPKCKTISTTMPRSNFVWVKQFIKNPRPIHPFVTCTRERGYSPSQARYTPSNAQVHKTTKILN